MLVTERDRAILHLVSRFRFVLGRHIKELIQFTGTRACDRRLKVLIEAGYLDRRKYLYGVPYLYTLTHKGRMLIGSGKHSSKIRLEQIAHDIYVLDALIFFKERYHLPLDIIESEKELHIKDGFSVRKHHPDFVFTHANTKYAVEVELTPKAKANLERNVRLNYMAYDVQVWLTSDSKVFRLITELSDEYPNIKIFRLDDILCQ